MSGFHHHSFYRYPIENPPNLADTGKKHYICIRNQKRNLPVTSFIYEIHISHTICGEIRFVVGDYKKDPNEVEGNDTCPPEQVHSASTFPFSPPNTCFRLGIVLSLRTDWFYVPWAGMYIPRHGTYIPAHRMYVPRRGI